ncbi:Rds1 protein [Coprinopsis sp. MPI-PUGE-AT-0042]|nr:Rds1 protein [Coprinopsis sp. MPI-PUGE-AT-0042]
MFSRTLLAFALGATFYASATPLVARNNNSSSPPPPAPPNLALNQEWIELDLFHYDGLARFSDEEFEEVGIGAEERFLLQHMADQEVGHGARPCTYQYPISTVREFLQFSQVLTRWGEAGVYGFLEHLDSRPAATMLLNSITVEARQQMAFRQLEGLFPMPEWHETGITQSMAWTLLAPHLVECPAENPRIKWRNFPGLTITNPSDPITVNNSTEPGENNQAALSNNRRQVDLTWEDPGKTVSYNNSYTTSTSAGNSGSTIQPGGNVWGPNTVSILNNTVFVLITDSNPYVTPFNLSKLDDHVVAGPVVYTVG